MTPSVALANALTVSSAIAPTNPAAGTVSTHAPTSRRTTDQCTTSPARATPVPTTPPATTCVVDSENPKKVDAKIVVALAVSAEKPCAASTVVTCVPSVRITLQPPENVPSATE